MFAGHVIDQRYGGPITIGFGRFGPNAVLDERLAVEDVTVIREGRPSVSTGAPTAGPGETV